MTESIEAAPLELSEEQAEFLLDYHCTLEPKLASSVALFAITMIARETMLQGQSLASHKYIMRMSGACRRTVDKAMKRLKAHNLIERVGTTEAGSAIYRATFVGAPHGLA